MTADLIDECRAAFEAIQKRTYGAQADDTLSRDANGVYENRFLYHQWLGFQQAWELQDARIKVATA